MSAASALAHPEMSEEIAYYEDASATVFLFSDPGRREFRMQINGSPFVAYLTKETKLLGHLPLMIHPSPHKALIVAFGMGNTYRSALSHGIDVDVAEINGFVPKLTSGGWSNHSV